MENKMLHDRISEMKAEIQTLHERVTEKEVDIKLLCNRNYFFEPDLVYYRMR